MSVGIIVPFAALNIRSLASTAFSSAGFGLLMLVPSAQLAAAGIANWRRNPFVPVFVAGVVLRVREPELPRPFRVPVGTVGVGGRRCGPVAGGAFVLVANGVEYLIYGSLVALTGPLLYALAERRARRAASV